MERKAIKQLIRLGDADLDGSTYTYHALTKIKGVGNNFSNAVCRVLKIDRDKKLGELSQEERNKIMEVIKNPMKFGIKSWMLNRRKEQDTGEDKHLISSELKLRKDFDIKAMKEIKSYRGMRHAYGLPVRGQRTKGHFRKGKSIGVKRKAGAKKGRT